MSESHYLTCIDNNCEKSYCVGRRELEHRIAEVEKERDRFENHWRETARDNADLGKERDALADKLESEQHRGMNAFQQWHIHADRANAIEAKSQTELAEHREYISTIEAIVMKQNDNIKKLLTGLRFYAQKHIWGNGIAAIDPCDTFTCELGVLRGGKKAIQILQDFEPPAPKDLAK